MPKVAVVTGGTRGLGRALSVALAERGFEVVATGRNPEALEALRELARERGLSIAALASDVADPDHHEALAQRLQRAGRSIDLLIHNASLLGPRVALQEYPAEAFRQVWEVNVWGPFGLTQRLSGALAEGATVQFISSGVGIVGKARWGAYSVSKFGLEGMAQIWAEEWRERGIMVHIIDPGSMRTAMRAEAYPDEDPMSLQTPEELIEGYLWLALEAGFETSGRRYKMKELLPTLALAA